MSRSLPTVMRIISDGSPAPRATRAVFVDRDGTLIYEPQDGRVSTETPIRLRPTVNEAMKELAALHLPIVIATNQSGISEGRLTSREFWAIHRKVTSLLTSTGVELLGTFVCPHSASDECQCRKPRPGLLVAAAAELRLDLPDCWMIGNECTDALAGRAAGTRAIVLAECGRARGCQADYVASTLIEAVHLIGEERLGLDAREA